MTFTFMLRMHSYRYSKEKGIQKDKYLSTHTYALATRHLLRFRLGFCMPTDMTGTWFLPGCFSLGMFGRNPGRSAQKFVAFWSSLYFDHSCGHHWSGPWEWGTRTS